MNLRRLSALLCLIGLVLGSLGCQLSSRWAQPTPTLAPSATLPPVLTNTPQPSATPTATAIPPSHTPTPSATPTPTPAPTAAAWQMQVFEELWRTVNENYLYSNYNGADWNAIYLEFSQRVQGGLETEAFYDAMREMVARLGDDHSAFLSPEDVKEDEARYAGQNDYVGIGILSIPVPERERITIILTFPGSPAEAAGLRAHDSILAVDNQPIIGPDGVRRDLIRGPEGTEIELTVQSPGDAPRALRITRQRILGAYPVPYQALPSAQGQRIGYILLPTFADSTIDDQLYLALQDLTRDAALDGLILDNRHNGGGASPVVRNILGYFTSGTTGYFVERNQERAFNVSGEDIRGSQTVPLVVLVGDGTASFGEIFAGVLRDLGRAYIIGSTSDGNVEVLRVYDFSDGSRAWIAHETFRPFNHPEEDWETTGIVPDLSVDSAWDQVTLPDDPVIQAALDYFDSLP